MGARPSKEELVGVILAAGKGTRMAPLPTPLPKPLLPVMGKPILQHQLELMKQYGIRRVFIVVNHQGVEIVRHLERSANPELTIDYIEQPEPLGTAHAVATLRDCIDSPFLLLLGDIFFTNSSSIRPSPSCKKATRRRCCFPTKRQTASGCPAISASLPTKQLATCNA